MQILLWLLLPIAAASGWWAALYSQKQAAARSQARLNSAYGRGLNHLLNEEPDKATEVLVQMVAVDPDTVELHLALGSLFRRRGEVDRAIRVHQNIVSRSRLSDQLRFQATLELGRDFLRAGLLDRAEDLLLGLVDKAGFQNDARQHLLELYQQQKEWGKAIEVAECLVVTDSESWKQRVAHFNCELAQRALDEGCLDVAHQWLDKAVRQDYGSIRALIMRGRVFQANKEYAAASEVYQQLESAAPEFIAEVYDDLIFCGGQDGRLGMDEAARHRVIERPRYRCECCGFTGKKVFWQCPGCQQWGGVKPVKAGAES